MDLCIDLALPQLYRTIYLRCHLWQDQRFVHLKHIHFIGQADVRQIYKVSKVGTIAGCMVTDGKMKRDCKVRLIREGIVVYTGKLGSLRRFENDVKEVLNGYECGMTIENFNDIKVGDILEGFEDQEVEE